jgi:hypothetical protein
MRRGLIRCEKMLLRMCLFQVPPLTLAVLLLVSSKSNLMASRLIRLSIVLSFTLVHFASAQIVITESDVREMFEGRVVETYVGEDVTGLNHLISRTGAGQTFDFTSAAFELEQSYAVESISCSPALAGCEDPFLGTANHVLRFSYADSTFIMFQSIDANGVSILGSAVRLATPEDEREFLDELGIDPDIDSLTYANRFVPAMLELALPLTMGATWESTSMMETVLVEADFNLTDDIEMEISSSSVVDGWGELITPHGSASALRFRTEHVSRTSFFGFQFADTTYSITYVTTDGLQAELDLDDGGQVVEASYTRFTGSVSNESAIELPDGIALHQNYPNPFNPSTTIAFVADQSAHIRVAVYDVLGREISVLHDGRLAAGRHEVVWNAASRPSGTYMVRLETESGTISRSMILLK